MSEETSDEEELVKVITKTTKRRKIIDKKSYSKWSNIKEIVIGKDGGNNQADVLKKNEKTTNIKQNQQKKNERKRDGKKVKEMVKKKRKKDTRSMVLVSSSSSQENGGHSEDSSYNMEPLMLTYDEEDKKEKKRKKRTSPISDSDYENPIQSKNGKVLSLNKHMQNLIRAAIKSGKFEKNKYGKVTKQECNSIRTRSSPKPLMTALESLNDNQKQAVRDIGFGSILELSLYKIPSKIGYFVVDSFDERTLKIRLESCYIQIDKEVVHDMLGVPLGGVKIKKEKISKGDDEVTKEWRKSIGMVKGHIRPRHVVEAIIKSPDAGRNFILNFLVLFNTCMAENTIMGTCNLKFLPYVNEDVDIKNIDWCQYIIDCLKDSKIYWDRADCESFYTGPLALLVLFYVDSTKCSRFQVIRTRPALKAWNSELLKKREDAEISLGGFGRGEVEIPFEVEQKKALANMDKNDNKFENFGKAQEGRTSNIDQEGRTQQDCHSEDFNVEEYIDTIKAVFADIVTQKEKLFGLLVDSSSRFPYHEQLQHYKKIVEEFFGQSTDATKTKSRKKLPVDDEVVSGRYFHETQVLADGMTGNLEELSDYSDSFLKQIDDTVEGILGAKNKDDVAKHYSDTLINQNDDSFEGPLFNLNVTQEMKKSLQDNVEQKEEVCVNIPKKLLVKIKVSHKNKEPEIGRNEEVQAMPISALMPSERDPTTPLVAKFAVSTADVNADVNTVRVRKPSEYVKSPYKERVVDVSASLFATEKKVHEYLYSFDDAMWNVIFESKEGYMLIPDVIQTILPGKWVLITIIDIWSYMLNCDEVYRGPKSPLRFFSSTISLTKEIVESGNLNDSDFKYFEDRMFSYMNFTNNLKLLADVEIVFIPILVEKHYYLICFNLKRTAFLIIDNYADEIPVDDKYKHAPYVVRTMFVKYLEKIGHNKAKSVMMGQPQRVKMKWRTKENIEDCGIFVMRHMESYKKEHIRDWHCGLYKEGAKQNSQLNALRIKYAAKILLSDFNIHKGKVIESMEKFSNLDKTEKDRIMVKNAIKIGQPYISIK